jgi:SAM-dependent methyltransferase
MEEPTTRAAPFDYDDEVFRGGIDLEAGYEGCILRDEYRDVHPTVADELMVADAGPVLDMGAGTGTLGRLLDERGVAWFGIDRSRVRMAAGYGPRARADASRLPFQIGLRWRGSAVHAVSPR